MLLILGLLMGPLSVSTAEDASTEDASTEEAERSQRDMKRQHASGTEAAKFIVSSKYIASE